MKWSSCECTKCLHYQKTFGNPFFFFECGISACVCVWGFIHSVVWCPVHLVSEGQCFECSGCSSPKWAQISATTILAQPPSTCTIHIQKQKPFIKKAHKCHETLDLTWQVMLRSREVCGWSGDQISRSHHLVSPHHLK